MTLKFLSVVESRPDWIKVSAISEAIQRFNRYPSGRKIHHVLTHTAQSREIADGARYFNDLELPKPDKYLGVSGAASAMQKSAMIAESFANVVLQERPAIVLVTGDADSALDCALVTKRIRYLNGTGQALFPALAHVEAGFRNFDRRTGQEVNRVVIDLLSDYLFTSEETSNENLLREGVPADRIHFVGSVIIDTLLRHRTLMWKSSILSDLQLISESSTRPFALLAVPHICASGQSERLREMEGVLLEMSKRMPVIFPASPSIWQRVRNGDLAEFFIDHFFDGPEPRDSRVRIRIIPPLGYLDFIRLLAAAKVVLTDSTGVQEEAQVLGVPCITLAEYASRPVTLVNGANVVVGSDPERILKAFLRSTQGHDVPSKNPMNWDGRAAERIIDTLWNRLTPADTKGRSPEYRDSQKVRSLAGSCVAPARESR